MTGMVLIPAAAAICFTSAKVIYFIAKDLYFTIPLAAGAALYLLIAFVRRKNYYESIFYITAHELSHALAALIFGIRVFNISIKKTNGKVLLSDSNFIIGLAPYFFPLYAVITAVLYFAANSFWPGPSLKKGFLAAEGFFLAFHSMHTFYMIFGPLQPDLEEEGGRLFSITVIILFFCTICAAILIPMSGKTELIKELPLIFIEDQKLFYFKTIFLLKYIYSFFVK